MFPSQDVLTLIFHLPFPLNNTGEKATVLIKRLTQERYEKIDPALPIQRGNVVADNYTFLNAILCVMVNSCK